MNTVDVVGDDDLTRMLIEGTLENYEDDSISKIGEYAFSPSLIKTIDVPNVTYVDKGAFNKCVSLISVNIPKAETIGNNAFYQCSSLKSIRLPNVKSIGNGAFNYSGLVEAEIGTNLNSVCSIGNQYAFPSSTNIYVPDALVEQYKKTSYWTYFKSKIFPISSKP